MPELLPNVRLQLVNTPENVVLVREMLTGVAEAVDVGSSELNDIRTAVTEACNNVVLHAYEGNPGPMEIELHILPTTLRVLVRDHGRGIDARPDLTEAATAGIGLHVIRTLAQAVQFTQAPGGGTDVLMEFSLSHMSALEPYSEKQRLPAHALTPSPSTTMLSILPVGLARTVLPRLVSTLAARAHFSTDRISDVQLLADALVAHAHTALSGDQLSVGVDVEPHEIELRIAPLSAGHAQRLLEDSELDGLGRVIEKLTNRHGVASEGSHETLTLGLIEQR